MFSRNIWARSQGEVGGLEGARGGRSLIGGNAICFVIILIILRDWACTLMDKKAVYETKSMSETKKEKQRKEKKKE